jgi:hypothetical protein
MTPFENFLSLSYRFLLFFVNLSEKSEKKIPFLKLQPFILTSPTFEGSQIQNMLA